MHHASWWQLIPDSSFHAIFWKQTLTFCICKGTPAPGQPVTKMSVGTQMSVGHTTSSNVCRILLPKQVSLALAAVFYLLESSLFWHRSFPKHHVTAQHHNTIISNLWTGTILSSFQTLVLLQSMLSICVSCQKKQEGTSISRCRAFVVVVFDSFSSFYLPRGMYASCSLLLLSCLGGYHDSESKSLEYLGNSCLGFRVTNVPP